MGESSSRAKKTSAIVALHILLAFYSFSGVLSKLAAKEEFLSINFCLLYFGMILILFVYAIVWQQIIKRIPLTTAFANKAACTIWGSIWGIIIFNEKLSLFKAVGILLIVFGIVLFSTDKENNNG